MTASGLWLRILRNKRALSGLMARMSAGCAGHVGKAWPHSRQPCRRGAGQGKGPLQLHTPGAPWLTSTGGIRTFPRTNLLLPSDPAETLQRPALPCL